MSSKEAKELIKYIKILEITRVKLLTQIYYLEKTPLAEHRKFDKLKPKATKKELEDIFNFCEVETETRVENIYSTLKKRACCDSHTHFFKNENQQIIGLRCAKCGHSVTFYPKLVK